MRYLLFQTLRLTLAFIGLIIPPLLLGRAQPPDSRITTLHLTDCAPPCWVGIMPGQATWREARTLFRQSYPGHAPFLIAPNQSGGGVRVLTYQDVKDSIDTMPQIFMGEFTPSGNMVENSRLMPRLGDVLLLWGLPTCVYASSNDRAILQFYLGADASGTLEIQIVGLRFSPAQPVYYLRFMGSSSASMQTCALQFAQTWSGFTKLNAPG